MGRSNRKRINISVDPKTYERLQKIKQMHGFATPCSLVLAFVHILVDRVEEADQRVYDLPDDEDRYISEMFEELGSMEKTYERLQKIKQMHGFATPCSLVLAFVHILVDRVEEADQRVYDLPDDEDRYISEMFEELSSVEKAPDGSVPIRHPNQDRYG